jgi:glycerophosphoryl diester phosphodiesterase
MKVIGHRGASGHEPENTLRSIAKAIELGADMVEIDVFLLPSGEVILMHDDRVDRTTDGRGLTLHTPFEDLRKLDAGKGEHIPTLQEVIELVDKRVPIVIEIKNAGSAQSVAHIVGLYLKRGWQPDRFIASSYNHPELRLFKNLMPTVKTAALLYSIPLDYAAFCIPLGAEIIAPAVDLVTPDFVADAHARGLLLYAWVWQPVYEEEIQNLYTMGVDGLYADFVDEAFGTIKTYKSILALKETVHA